MNITTKGGYGSLTVIVTAENVKIEEEVTEGIYAIKDGKEDYSKRIGSQVASEHLTTFVNVLDDLIYQRETPFDSSSLIKSLFDKLPEDKMELLVNELQSKL